jgi:coniferyl-aldehyde dehydrogenase
MQRHAISEVLKELIAAAFDESELAVVTGGAAVGAAFTALAFDHLIFTGGTAVGKHVAHAAADNLVPLTLELGGKSPAIVGTSVDLEQAASRILTAKVLNSGQLCVSPDYALVPEAKRDALVDIATATVSRLFPTQKGNPDYTTIVNQRHFERINGLIEDARAKGAKVVALVPAGEEPIDPATRRIAPTLVLDTKPGMKILEEEIFGPVLPVLTYTTIDEAIGYITRPLALYYFGTDAFEERLVLDKTISGGVTINDCVSHLSDENLPFGGVGDSGMGAYHGRYGFLTFSHAKSVYRQADVVPAAALIAPPFGAPIRAFFDQAFAAFAPPTK